MTRRLRDAIAKAYNYKCQYCDRKHSITWHIDHIIPRCKGGEDTLLNYTLACSRCNLKKSGTQLTDAGVQLLLAIAESKQDTIKRLLMRKVQASACSNSLNVRGNLCVEVDGSPQFFTQKNMALFFSLEKYHQGHRVEIKAPPGITKEAEKRVEWLKGEYAYFVAKATV